MEKDLSGLNYLKVKIARAITQSKTKEYHSRPEIKLRNKDKGLKRAFGITLEEYNKKLIEQNNVCDICNKPETSKRYKYLAVDHCHKTNKVRGLLCNRCNRAIGMLQDDIQLLLKAIGYIKKHQENET